MSAAYVVHAHGEGLGFRTLCRVDDGGRISGFAAAWTCADCLRMWHLLERVQAAADRFRRSEDVRVFVAAVAPGVAAIQLLDEDQARRVLVVLDKALSSRRFERRGGAA